MKTVRLGIVGMGNMGTYHTNYLLNPATGIQNVTLAAICDNNSARLAKAVENFGAGAPKVFATHAEMFASKEIDAVLIAVPHYDHVPMALSAFEAGLHVMVEKPLAVSVSAARQATEASKKYPQLKFGIMFNQRSNPMYQKLRGLIMEGELGEISRITWIVTNWFRTHAYYASGGWRATWKGEGGGVLINQCPHNLDLIQWITGMMPTRVSGVGFIAKTHPIEVEDEISAILEYANGAVGHFVTSTGEYPGTNRLEICGSRGKIIAENNKLAFTRTRIDVQEFNRTTKETFANPETWQIDVPFTPRAMGEHQFVLQDFVNCIVNDAPTELLLAPGCEGTKGLELGNAMLMAGITRQPVDLPLDGAKFDVFIAEMTQKYDGKKSLQVRESTAGMGGSFQKA